MKKKDENNINIPSIIVFRVIPAIGLIFVVIFGGCFCSFQRFCTGTEI